MVGIFSRFSDHMRYRLARMDTRECLLPKRDEVAETGKFGGIEFKVEFEPIEHPQEPTDEDHPVKCPMPNSSVLSDGERAEELPAERLRKISGFTLATEEGMVVAAQPSVHPVRKRHQTLNRDRVRPPLFRASHSSFLQIFRESNEFEP